MRSCSRCDASFEDGTVLCPEDGSVLLEVQDGPRIDPRIGGSLGGYTLAAKVADGAMGRVYEAYGQTPDERKAVKVLHSSIARTPVNVERFRREYETAMDLDHPRVVKALEFGATPDGSHYMVMDFLDGAPLADRLRDAGRFSLERSLRLIAQIAEALNHAHASGIIHRDLKPDNVFLCDSLNGEREESVCLLDFGSVKLQMEIGERLTAMGTTLGSPSYMSPEQASGERDIDQRTDIFAMGTLLYEFLSGRIAFDGPNMVDILNKVLYADCPPLSEAPPQLARVVMSALHKDKDRRPRSASEFVEACIAALGLDMTGEELAHAPAAEIALALSMASPPSLAPTEPPDPPDAPAAVRQGSPARPSQQLALRWGIVAVIALAGAALYYGLFAG